MSTNIFTPHIVIIYSTMLWKKSLYTNKLLSKPYIMFNHCQNHSHCLWNNQQQYWNWILPCRSISNKSISYDWPIFSKYIHCRDNNELNDNNKEGRGKGEQWATRHKNQQKILLPLLTRPKFLQISDTPSIQWMLFLFERRKRRLQKIGFRCYQGADVCFLWYCSMLHPAWQAILLECFHLLITCA